MQEDDLIQGMQKKLTFYIICQYNSPRNLQRKFLSIRSLIQNLKNNSCLFLNCEKHPIYSPKPVHKTPSHNLIRKEVIFKLFRRVLIKLNNSLHHACYSQSCYKILTLLEEFLNSDENDKIRICLRKAMKIVHLSSVFLDDNYLLYCIGFYFYSFSTFLQIIE